MSIADALFEKLSVLSLYDYEVWVAKSDEMQLEYELIKYTRFGPSPHIEDTAGGLGFRTVRFKSREEAYQAFLDEQEAVKGLFIDYEIVAVLPDFDWIYLDTFDAPDEAHDYLDTLMEAIGDEYTGKVVKVQLDLPGLD